MKRIFASIAAAGVGLAFGASAFAADIAPMYAKAPPAPPPFSWSGFYVGAQGGAGWGTTTDNVLGLAVCVAPGPCAPFGANTGTPQRQINGWHGGVTAGYNWQIGQIVLGAEGDWSAADISGKGDCSSLLGGIGIVSGCSSKLGDFATIDGRFGFAVDRALIYVKGGVAYGHFSDTLNGGIGGGLTVAASATDNRWGGTAGVGVEYAVAKNWSAKLEYDYMDFGTRTLNTTVTTNIPGTTLALTDSVREQVSVVKAGVNYRFDWR